MNTLNFGNQSVHSRMCILVAGAALLAMTACGGRTGGPIATTTPTSTPASTPTTTPDSTPTPPVTTPPVTPPTTNTLQVATPAIVTNAALNGAEIMSLTTSTSGAVIHYTLDGSTPTASSQRYLAPVLISSGTDLNAIATMTGYADSLVATQTFTPSTAPATLTWSDEFDNTTGVNAQPDPKVWTYDVGGGGWGNSELETYCGWTSTQAPCTPSTPNSYVGTDGYLHVVARNPSPGVYTSARLKTHKLFSIAYGRIEARIKVPESQGMWPAFWLLGNDITKVSWPACGEQDIMEHVDAQSPDWFKGSIHATGLDGGKRYPVSTGTTYVASDWHVYGMIWKKGSVSFYIDSPTNVYVTFTDTNLVTGAVWPFDSDSGAFILLNLAVGGGWPGSPDATTTFPSEMLVDYVRVYNN
jgi:beta-glucanase (GH16 family)